MKFTAVFWVLCFFLEVIQSQGPKPIRQSFHQYRLQKAQNSENASNNCNDIFSYHSDDDGFFGMVTIAKPDPQKSLVRVFLSLAALLPSQYFGRLELAKDARSSIIDIKGGYPLHLRIVFPVQDPIPKVTAIFYNEQELCTAPGEVGNVETQITLDYSFIYGYSHQNYIQQPKPPAEKVPTFRIAPPPQKTTFTKPPTAPQIVTTTSTLPPQTAGTPDLNFECGVAENEITKSTPLIIGGRDVNRGQFPWLAALYYTSQINENGFICGGSLVSTRIVVTAAHCIQGKGDGIKKEVYEVLIYLSKLNLESLKNEAGNVLSPVSEFFIHPDWDTLSDSYDADVAVAVLSITVVFNKFVRPICLWAFTNSYDDIIGEKGIVAGWGITEDLVASTTRPKWTEIPVVKTDTCLRSHTTFSKLTSERTFCAGSKEDGKFASRISRSGPCNGDSGGGFIIKTSGRWYLRGVVSSALLNQETQTCDTDNYAVFTDMTKFVIWVKSYVQTYG